MCYQPRSSSSIRNIYININQQSSYDNLIFTELFLDILKSLPDRETRLFSGNFRLLSSSNYYVSKYSNIFNGVLRLGELAVRLLLNYAFLSGLETIANQLIIREGDIYISLFSNIHTSPLNLKILSITFRNMHKFRFNH